MAEDNKLAPGVSMTRPTSQTDLELRLEQGFMGDRAATDNTKNDALNPEKVVAPYKVEGNDTTGYVGVSPEYMTYANDTEKPLTATEGPEAESLQLLQANPTGVVKTQPLTEGKPLAGRAAVETIYTATSGEGYSAKLVDPPKEYTGSNVVGLPEEQVKAEQQVSEQNADSAGSNATTGAAGDVKSAPSAPAPTKSTTAAKK